jgi:hypothetical protein
MSAEPTQPGPTRAGPTRAGAPRWVAHTVAVFVLGCFAVSAWGNAQNASLLEGLPITFVLVTCLSVGWLLAWKRSENPLGWMLMAVTGLLTFEAPVALLGHALADTAPVASAWLLWFGGDREDTWAWLPAVGLLLTQIPLRFPDGRLPSPRWRWFSWFTIAAIVFGSAVLSAGAAEVAPGIANPTHIAGLTGLPWVLALVFGPLAVSFVGASASLIVRYRASGDVERAQLRWVLWAVAIAVGTLVLGWIVNTGWISSVDLEVFNVLGVSAYALIPISIGIAVLRYRLYEIDRIISRTAAYALVSLMVLAVYALVVTSVTWLFPGMQSVGVALATLAAAALFLPALRWIRRRVDRRFDREQYDAQRVVEKFGEGLRTGADPHTSGADLLAAVEQTLKPDAVGLWTPGGSR